MTTADSCAKTGTKLAGVAEMLGNLALDKVRAGDEDGARKVLQEKASVREALDKNTARADANYELAKRLSAKIVEYQELLLFTEAAAVTRSMRSAPPPAPSYTPSIPSAPFAPPPGNIWSPLSTGSSAGSSETGPQWQWQTSLDEARKRLDTQERSAVGEGRRARMGVEEDIMRAKQRIAESVQSTVHSSVLEGQQRLRGKSTESGSSVVDAQARLKARDEEVLAHVKKVMARYRRGEYVSDSELEFAFKQLEQRFT